MEHEFTDNILALAASLDGIINGSFDLSDDYYHVADDIWDEMTNGLPALVAYLNEEHGKGRTEDKLMDYLRERLQTASQTIINYGKEHIDEPVNGYDAVLGLCDEWIEWIDRYFPIDPGGQETKSKKPKPKKQSKAEIRLQSQELQEVKKKLIAAGIIVDGVWQGTPAEFGCLVNELFCERRVSDHGRKTWKILAEWVGYQGNQPSARSAIEKNQDTIGPTADLIRDICKPK